MREGYAARDFSRVTLFERIRRFFAALWLGEPVSTIVDKTSTIVPTTSVPQSALQYPSLPGGWRPARFIEENPEDERLMREADWRADAVWRTCGLD
jgi:hypothetical protein